MSCRRTLLLLSGLFPLWPCVALAQPPPTEATPVVLTEWDGEFMPYGPFHSEGIAVDNWGNVYVTDQLGSRVLKFRADGTYVTEWGSLGSNPGEFDEPYHIVCDPWNSVFVVDAGNGRVQKFSDSGDYILEWTAVSSGSDPWLFGWPRGICSDDLGQIYVTDPYYDAVFKFDNEGGYLHYWGGSGPIPGYFNYPWGLEADGVGRILVADRDNSRINLYDQMGAYLTDWAGPPWDLDRPVDVAVDQLAHVYLLDRQVRRLLKVELDGSYITEVHEFTDPAAVAVFGRGSIYVANTGDASIKKLGYPPEILAIDDIGDDQGGWVRLTWHRSHLDRIEWPMVATGYGVYRRQDVKATSLRRIFDERGQLIVGEKGMEGWDVVATIPARGDSLYQYVAPTLCDSSAIGGICWSVYAVSVFTDYGEFFDSAADSGYSVDNIPPPVLGAPVVDEVPGAVEIEVAWDASTALDFSRYGVYRGSAPDFTPGDPYTPYAEVTSPLFVDTSVQSGETWYYRVAVFDDADNFSGYSDAAGAQVLTGVGDGRGPLRFALYENVPNPFNPMTTIRFDLPTRQQVAIDVYAVNGRHVTTVLSTTMPAGSHSVVWDGRDASGRVVASGTYYCKLVAGAYTETRTMVLVR